MCTLFDNWIKKAMFSEKLRNPIARSALTTESK